MLFAFSQSSIVPPQVIEKQLIYIIYVSEPIYVVRLLRWARHDRVIFTCRALYLINMKTKETTESTPCTTPCLPRRHNSAPPTISIRGSPPSGSRFVNALINRRNGQQINIICFASAIDTSILILQNLGFTNPNQPTARVITYSDLIRCPVIWGTLVAFRGYQGFIDFDTTRNDALLFLFGSEGRNFRVLASAIDDAGAIDCFIPSLGLSLYDLLDLCLTRPVAPVPKTTREDSPRSSSDESDMGEIVTAAETLSLLLSESREGGIERPTAGEGRQVKERSRSPPHRAPSAARPQKKRTIDEAGEGFDVTGLPEGIYRGYSKSWANACASCGTRSSPVWRKGWAADEPCAAAEEGTVVGGPDTLLELTPPPSRQVLLANLCNACGLQFAAGNILPGDPRSKGAVVVGRRRTH